MSESISSVPRLHLPDVDDFRRRFEAPRQPVVITGAMADWKAMTRWSPDYFGGDLGDTPLSIMVSDEDLPEDGPIRPDQMMRSKSVTVSMRDYVQQMAQGRVLRAYVSGLPLKKYMPVLLGDIDPPEYREVGTTPSPRMWLGTCVVGPLHYDPCNNLHGIVYGGKRFLLFAPDQLPYLYPCSMWSTIPQMSQASLSKPDYERFPRLRKARPVTVDLVPGDMLFLPAGWWHQVDTPTPTISIDFPWQRRPTFGRPFLRLHASHALRKVRGRISYK